MAIDVHISRESAAEIRLTYPTVKAFLMCAFVAAVGGWMAFFSKRPRFTGFSLALVACFSLLFLALAVLILLTRHEIALDLNAHRFTRRKGIWPNIVTTEGPISSLEVVLLNQIPMRTDSAVQRLWSTVGLVFPGEGPTIFHESRSESRAAAVFERFARTLKTRAIDRTRSPETRMSWQEVGRPLADGPLRSPADDQLPAGAETAKTESLPDCEGSSAKAPDPAFPSVPYGSGIEVEGLPGSLVIRLAPERSNEEVRIPLTLGRSFVLGAVAIFVWQVTRHWGHWQEAIEPAVLCLAVSIMGLVQIGWVLKRNRTRIVIRGGPLLTIAREGFGRSFSTFRVAGHEVEEVAVKPSLLETRSGRRTALYPDEVVVRSPDRTWRYAGSLTSAEKEWLCAALSFLIQHP